MHNNKNLACVPFKSALSVGLIALDILVMSSTAYAEADTNANTGDTVSSIQKISSGTEGTAQTDSNVPHTQPQEQSVSESATSLVEQQSAMDQQNGAVEAEANELIQQLKDRKLHEADQAQAEANAVKPGDVRVNHIPEFIKQEIKESLRAELRQDVLEDLIQHAETQRWGLPDAQPEWFSRIKFKGDVRLRAQDDMMGEDNINPLINGGDGYFDFKKLNDKGGFGKTSNPYLNTWEDRVRYRVRARLNVDAQVSTSIKSSMRITTGNTSDPVSTNQTMGDYGNRYTMVWDRIFLRYKGPLTADRQWLTILGGRMPNPWFSTDLIWDSDLAFDGVAANFDINLRGSDSLDDINENDRTMFVTIGAFPLQEVQLSKDDKWLFATQIGAQLIADNQSSVKIGLAYYNFYHIEGKRNSFDSDILDYTAPDYMQKGNLLFDIRNDTDLNTDLWALASDYNELAFTAEYDVARFAPVHIVVTGEYVANVGYNKDEILARTNGAIVRSGGLPSDSSGNVTLDDVLNDRPTGFQIMLSVGWPQLTLPGNWRASLAYKRIEGDAVLDAFTDSDFHLGGTNAKGWILGYEHGIDENTWLSARYISSQTITGATFDVETFQLDLNAKF